MLLNCKEHSFNTGSVILNYAEGPASGPPLVLLHGGSARWQAFKRYLKELLASKQGKIRESAEIAGITTRQLHKLLTKYGIKKEDFKSRTGHQ